MDRKLVAILAADVVGYSKLMADDEAGTLAALKTHRKELFDPEIEKRNGRIVKLVGDGVLVEFLSVIDAAECAIAIQQALTKDDGPIKLRIGINLGDVIVEGEDIYGDGVNLAARLEGLAEPGGVCISSLVYESVGNRIDSTFEYAGEHEVKNIDRPIKVWMWSSEANSRSPANTESQLAKQNKPSIAVLPFDNMSGDPEQDYFADGVVEDIITALSRMPWLFVIARNSSFVYKGRAVDVKEVGRDLGVRYVLEGSIRKAGGKLRITGQLIDATTSAHLWADRYDGSLEDIFDLQDQVTSSVVGAIAPKLELAEIERAKYKPTSSLDAYDNYLRGMAAFHRWAAEENEEALNHFYRAIEIDPDFAIAHGMAARCINQLAVVQPSAIGTEEITEAKRLARRAADLGRNDALALCMAGITLGFVVRDVAGGPR